VSKGPADPARSTQNEDAFVGSLNLARSASSFADVVKGENGGEGCTGCNGKVSCGWKFHCGFREERGEALGVGAGPVASFQVQMFNFVFQIGKQYACARDIAVRSPTISGLRILGAYSNLCRSVAANPLTSDTQNVRI